MVQNLALELKSMRIQTVWMVHMKIKYFYLIYTITLRNQETDDLSVNKNDIKLKSRTCGDGNVENTDNTLVVLYNDPDDFIKD